MEQAVNLWPLIGIAAIVVGFILRFNPVLVVIAAGIITGLAALMPLDVILEKLGEGFLNTRNLPLILLLPLAVIGLLERHGLKERAQAWIAKIKSATAGRLLIVYLFVREITAAMGLTSPGGHPQMVRPLLAPMAEGATENRYGELPERTRHRLRAMSAATDNVGLFFGEDIFVAFGAIIFMHNFMLESGGIQTEPLHIALWGIPTAIFAFLIHALRLYRMDKQLSAELAQLNQAALQAKGRHDELPATISLLAGRRGAADCGGDVLPRSRQPAPHHHRAVLGLYGLVFRSATGLTACWATYWARAATKTHAAYHRWRGGGGDGPDCRLWRCAPRQLSPADAAGARGQRQAPGNKLFIPARRSRW